MFEYTSTFGNLFSTCHHLIAHLNNRLDVVATARSHFARNSLKNLMTSQVCLSVAPKLCGNAGVRLHDGEVTTVQQGHWWFQFTSFPR